MKQDELKGSESYAVRFWIQKADGFWEQREEIFNGLSSEDDHAVVEHIWKKKHSNDNTKLISVSYQ